MKVVLLAIFLGIFFYSSSVYGIKCHVCSSLVQDCVTDTVKREDPCKPEDHPTFAKPECHIHKENEIECGAKDSPDSPFRKILRDWYAEGKKGDVIKPPGFDNFMNLIMDANSHTQFTYNTCIKIVSDQPPKDDITGKYTPPATIYGCGTTEKEIKKDLWDTHKIVHIFPDAGKCKQDLRNATTLKTWIKIWACGEDLCNKKDFGDDYSCADEVAIVPPKGTGGSTGSTGSKNSDTNNDPADSGPTSPSNSSFIKGSLIFVLILAFLSLI